MLLLPRCQRSRNCLCLSPQLHQGIPETQRLVGFEAGISGNVLRYREMAQLIIRVSARTHVLILALMCSNGLACSLMGC